jgi:hypothetical protein
MEAYYIYIDDCMYVKAILFDANGMSIMPAFDKEDAGIYELDKCEAVKKTLQEKAPELKIEFIKYEGGK